MTKKISRLAVSTLAVAASLLNRGAAARRLLEEAAKRGVDIAIVCAGRGRGAAYGLEDTAAAGAIVEAVHAADGAVALTDASWAALHLWRFYRGDAMQTFRHSPKGRALGALGFERDLRFAAQVDAYESVPVLYQERGILVLSTRERRRRTGTRA